jgi:tetratricopeptide (TPR) repeat protein
MNGLRLVFFIYFFSAFQSYSQNIESKETKLVDSLSKRAYDIRLIEPSQTLVCARKALALAKKINYKDGIGEAHRVLGIGLYHFGRDDKAMSNYLLALRKFEETKNLPGQSRVYNNIGNIYREINYDKALNYYLKGLQIAKKLQLGGQIAAFYLNVGIAYFRKSDLQKALMFSEKSHQLYLQQNHPTGILLALQNKGVIFYELRQIDKAENLLLEANKLAREHDLKSAVASINLTLIAINIAKKNYVKAEFFLIEGKKYANAIQAKKLQSDLLKASYELENARQNHEKALFYLQKLYTQDSSELQNTIAKKFGLFEEQSKFLAREKANAIQLEKAKTNQVIFIAALVVSLLAIVLIFILTGNIKKKVKTNNQLKILNEEISLQKENLNKVNQNLEKIIDERTQDLKIKNRKLSEYSSHLSHQIRGPIATMKGLMILEKENLIEDHEFITEIGKCVNEVDDRIVNINDVLHNLSESGLIPRIVDKETDS